LWIHTFNIGTDPDLDSDPVLPAIYGSRSGSRLFYDRKFYYFNFSIKNFCLFPISFDNEGIPSKEMKKSEKNPLKF